MTETKKEIPGISTSNIKKDLMQFKDDILKDIRLVQSSLDNKYLKADEYINEKISKFELKLNSFSEKITQLSNLIVTDTSIREKVDSLNEFKEEMKDNMFKRRAKFNELETQINNDISRINNVLSTTVLYPSLIGKSGKFKTFHEYIDYTVQEIAQLTLFKEKSGLDLTPFKRKLDTTIESFKLQMNTFCSKEYVDKLNKQTEENMKNLLKIFDDRLQDSRVENSQYAYSMKKKGEEMEKLVEYLKKMQNKLNKKLENQQNEENNYGGEINYIKSRIDKINEIIKELLTYHPQSKKNFMYELEKKSSKVYSGVKQYIKGNLNASELSSMKKFTYERSKTKIFDNSIPSTSPFPTGDLIKYNNEQRNHSNSIRSRDENGVVDKSKIYLNKNSFNDFDKKEKGENVGNIKKKTFLRRKTFNYDKIKSFNSLETYKLNGDNPQHHSNKKIPNIINNNIIEENNIKINKFSNDDNNDNIRNITINEENNKINISNNITLGNNNSKEKNNNAFVIKEEDENLLSDNSCKNLDVISQNKNINKNNLIEKIENKPVKKEEDNKNDSISFNEEKEKEKENNQNKNIKNNKNTDVPSEKNINNIKIIKSNNIYNNNNKDNREDKNINNNNINNNNNFNSNSNINNSINNNNYNNINNINNNFNKNNINNNINNDYNKNNINHNNKINDDSSNNNVNINHNNNNIINNNYNNKNHNNNINNNYNNNAHNNSINNNYNNNNHNNSINNNYDNNNITNNYSGDEKLKMKITKSQYMPNLDNDKIRIISFSKKVKSSKIENTSNNPNNLIHFFENKNTLNKINIQTKNQQKENINQNTITPRTNSNKKNISQSVLNQNPQNNYIINKNLIYKSPQSNNYISLENNKNNLRNKFSNLIPNNIMSINRINRTYTNFPKINKELFGSKIYNNNYIDPKDMNIIEKTLNVAKVANQNSKVAAYINKPKKVLLTSPDNILPNAKIKKSIIKNKYLGNQSEKKEDRITKLESFYNNGNNNFQSIPYQLIIDEEKVKSLKNIKGSKKI